MEQKILGNSIRYKNTRAIVDEVLSEYIYCDSPNKLELSTDMRNVVPDYCSKIGDFSKWVYSFFTDSKKNLADCKENEFNNTLIDPNNPLFIFRVAEATNSETLCSIYNVDNQKLVDLDFDGIYVTLFNPGSKWTVAYIPTSNCYYIIEDNNVAVEVYAAKDKTKAVVIDHYEETTFILDKSGNPIGSVKWKDNPEHIITAKMFDNETVEYIYNGNGILEDIKTDDESYLFSFSIDITDDDDNVTGRMNIYPIPYFITADDVFFFEDDYTLYKSELIEYDEDGCISSWSSNVAMMDIEFTDELHERYNSLVENN